MVKNAQMKNEDLTVNFGHIFFGLIWTFWLFYIDFYLNDCFVVALVEFFPYDCDTSETSAITRSIDIIIIETILTPGNRSTVQELYSCKYGR